MGLKEDAKFARFITMGAHGARYVAEDLEKQGHRIVELERYAMANKIWSTKVKRLRMADLLCVDCGRRFEAKAKTKLEVKLSDSRQQGRGWSEGMRAEDVFAFVPVTLDKENALLAIGEPLYLTTSSMLEVEPKQGQLKSATDGSERDVYWPITVAKRSGVVTRVQNGRITIETPGRRASTLGRASDAPLVRVGDHVTAGIVLGSPVRPETILACPGSSWDLTQAMSSDDAVEVFAAVKAVGMLRVTELANRVRAIAEDAGQDMRLRVEGFGALARLGDSDAVGRLDAVAVDGDVVAMQMEGVLVLSELVGVPSAAETLRDIANDFEKSDEIRAAAAWGLGTSWHDRFSYLWPLAFDDSEKVRRHVQASIGTPEQSDLPELIAALRDDDRAPFAASILASSGAVAELLEALTVESTAPWALQALGQVPPSEGQDLREQINDADRSALHALWLRNFQDGHNEPTNLTELKFLASQSLRRQDFSSMTYANEPSRALLSSRL